MKLRFEFQKINNEWIVAEPYRILYYPSLKNALENHILRTIYKNPAFDRNKVTQITITWEFDDERD